MRKSDKPFGSSRADLKLVINFGRFCGLTFSVDKKRILVDGPPEESPLVKKSSRVLNMHPRVAAKLLAAS